MMIFIKSVSIPEAFIIIVLVLASFVVAILPFAIFQIIRLLIFNIYSEWAWNMVVIWWNPAFTAPPNPNQMGDIGVYASFNHFFEDYIEGLSADGGMGARQRFQLMIIQEYENLLELFAIKIFVCVLTILYFVALYLLQNYSN